MNVDEARGNDVVLRIDDAVGLGPAETPDRVDAVTTDSDVGTVPRVCRRRRRCVRYGSTDRRARFPARRSVPALKGRGQEGRVRARWVFLSSRNFARSRCCSPNLAGARGCGVSLQGSRLAIPREPGYQTIEQPLFSARLLTGPRCTEMIGSGTGDCAPAPSHTTGRTVFRIRRLDPAAVPTRRKTGRPPTIDRLPCLVHRFLSGWTQHLPWLPPASARHGSTASASACSPFRSPSQGKDLPARDSGKPLGHCISRSSSLAPWSFGPSLQRHYPPSSLLWPLLTSPPLSPRSPPQVRCCFFPFIPSGSTSHVSDGHGASLWPASLPPVRGLSADSCSCAGSAGTGERALRVSVDAALRAGIFKASGSIDPIGFGDERERGLPRPWSSSR